MIRFLRCHYCQTVLKVDLPEGTLRLKGMTVSGNIRMEDSRVSFGEGGKIAFGEGSGIFFGGPPRQFNGTCSQCGKTDVYKIEELSEEPM